MLTLKPGRPGRLESKPTLRLRKKQRKFESKPKPRLERDLLNIRQKSMS